MPEQQVVLVSLDPNDLGSGGFLNDRNVTFTDCGFYIIDKRQDGSPLDGDPYTAFFSRLIDEEGSEYEQKWSIGKAHLIAPTEDNNRLMSVPAEPGAQAPSRKVQDSSRFAFFLTKLAAAGFQSSLWNELGAECMEGVKAHMVMEKPQRKRDDRSEEFGEQKDVIVIDALIEVPALEAGKKGAGKKASGSAALAKGPGAGGVKKSAGIVKPKAGGGVKTKAAGPEPEPGEEGFEIDYEELAGCVIETLEGKSQTKATIIGRLVNLEIVSGDENVEKRQAYYDAIQKQGYLDTMIEEGLLIKKGVKYQEPEEE